MQVELNAEDPLFVRLAEWFTKLQPIGIPLRLIGGGAMLIWSKHLETAPEMTSDLDCVLLRSDLPSEEDARTLCGSIVRALHSMGFHRPENWRSSRKARFCYQNSEDWVQIEFLAGELAVGSPSRREPAWKVVEIGGAPGGFYVAKVSALDTISDWVPCEVRIGDQVVALEVPTLWGLVGLKVKAVADKVARTQATEGEEQAHEMNRLRKHAQDALRLLEWIDQRGQVSQLVEHVTNHLEIAALAKEVVRWHFQHPETQAGSLLAPLRGHLERIALIGGSST